MANVRHNQRVYSEEYFKELIDAAGNVADEGTQRVLNGVNNKLYTYQIFLRCPETKEVQWGTIQMPSDGEFLGFGELICKLNMGHNKEQFSNNYTLIGMNIVSVEEING